jgi:predicted outer membrane repeat protein
MLALVGMTVVAGVTASPAHAVTFTVTSASDAGPGSLRQAIADANAAPGADTITFSVGGTVTLTTGSLVVSDALTIDGPSASSLTVSGNNLNGVLTVSPAGVTLGIDDLTLANGRASNGGAIFNNRGTVTVSRTVFSQNSATTGGGAINNLAGTVTISDSTFSGNSAFAGGAIENVEGGALTITSSTFTANSGLPGGAISNFGVSATSPSTATISNSTFAGNTAVVGGAIFNLRWGNVRATHSTFAGNSASGSPGGAVHNQGATITLENSIFAGNGCEGFDIADGGGNLDWPASGCPGVNADPKLGPLADNGGPTRTLAVEPGSGAIDAAVAANRLPTDQRGVLRPQGAGCDVGAFESDAADTTPPVITVPDDFAVDATSPAGAVVSYAASAEDDVDGAVAIACVPPSGSTFVIGTTTVECSASDAAGNEASASFDIRVKGAPEQLDDLIALVTGLSPGSSFADKLRDARATLADGRQAEACQKLLAFWNEAQAQSGKKLTAAQARQLIEAATRIRGVIGC